MYFVIPVDMNHDTTDSKIENKKNKKIKNYNYRIEIHSL